jgi:hypothetical protein
MPELPRRAALIKKSDLTVCEKLVNASKVGTNPVTSMWVAPLGQTPDYLDRQSQEALYEVDVSSMELLFPTGEALKGKRLGARVEGIDSPR